MVNMLEQGSRAAGSRLIKSMRHHALSCCKVCYSMRYHLDLDNIVVQACMRQTQELTFVKTHYWLNIGDQHN